jgi:hypothetical protein
MVPVKRARYNRPLFTKACSRGGGKAEPADERELIPTAG